MPKKKPANNGFYYFMIDLRKKHPNLYKNNQQASEAAGHIWKNMTVEEKRPFDDLARVLRNKEKVRYTSSGQNVEVLQRQEEEKKRNIQQMKEAIENTVLAAVEAKNLPDLIFHFIHVNYFCVYHKDYFPAEISVVRWSLRTGVTVNNIFSMICKPGALPIGYTAEARKISEETHQIPPPDSTECNLEEIAFELNEFLSMDGNDKYPPLYASSKNAPVVKNVLEQFTDVYGLQEFRVFSLEHLFFTLRNSSVKGKVWAVSSLAELELERDKYQFTREIACPFHENVDIPSWCSQSITVRTVFTFCDHCCEDLNIDLIPAQHVPKNAKIQSRPSSTISRSGEWEQVSSYHQTLQTGYLSRGDTDQSEISETSTIGDPNEVSESSEADDDWKFVTQKKKNSAFGQGGSSQSSSTTDYTQTSGQKLRRPTGLSNAFSSLSVTGESRGRGRGIAAMYGKK